MHAPSSPSAKGSMLHYRQADTPDGADLFEMRDASTPLFVPHSVLIDALLRALPPPPACTIRTSHPLTSCYPSTSRSTSRLFPLPPDGYLCLEFAGGATATADVLIGADGVHSTVRDSLFSNFVASGWSRLSKTELYERTEPRWTGGIMCRTLVQKDRLNATWRDHPALSTPMVYCGKGKHINTFPVPNSNAVDIAAFYTIPNAFGRIFSGNAERLVPSEKLRERYRGWEPEVQALLDCVEGPAKDQAVHSLGQLPRLVMSNVAIIGDAAHAMEPHFASGASQAIEDAYILGRLLTHPLTNRKRAGLALLVYEAVRLRTVNSLVLRSRELGCLTEFDCPGPNSHFKPYRDVDTNVGRNERDGTRTGDRADAEMEGAREARRKRWSEEVVKRWQWQWEGGPQENWKMAERVLGEAVQPGAHIDAGVGLFGLERENDISTYARA
ncbi:FAD/NAD-P-binding domain-containing protein [Stereum hirsutum FP-91666 SS1]|uniref:FAD/NAD-P-binding domain-containing protein n=1 Tax=Stereum hirsutum (strain FP-91666) TaxID=721885 RepID=UPI0004449DD5|nr:FAD/NAD-P-binding domain-containing protein [Stereum hirsutum FP-91666 SS1]EIM84051.1 FAD/NAD-P-binding domain-containing protein [Stereum hirsutum FP-91666 SS1]